jgi:hypothetical protein
MSRISSMNNDLAPDPGMASLNGEQFSSSHWLKLIVELALIGWLCQLGGLQSNLKPEHEARDHEDGC